MKNFIVNINSCAPYPISKVYSIQASNLATAIRRGTNEHIKFLRKEKKLRKLSHITISVDN